MSDPKLQVLVVVGSLQAASATRTVVHRVARRLAAAGCAVDSVDLAEAPLPLFNPETSWSLPGFLALKPRVERAEVFVLGTPDYHGGMSGVLKNFLDHFWCEFAGKLFVTLVASHEKGLTVTDQLRTVARQCYAWSLPYGVGFAAETEVKGGRVVSEPLQARLAMLTRDILVYGRLLAGQRRADLSGREPGFLARYRPTPAGTKPRR